MFVPIPNEILIYILETLSDLGDAASLKACSLVSSTWHTIAATFLFASLDLLCSTAETNAAQSPHRKSKLGLVQRLLPNKKKQVVDDSGPECACKRHQDKAVQLFHSSGASACPHIVQNVTEFKLVFCHSTDWPDSFSNGPHALQMYPDGEVLSLLRLVDQLSFVHLRRLTFHCVPQVLYYLNSDPFTGLLSSTALSLEQITFNTGSVSLHSHDIKRMLSKHAFSCDRFPRLLRVVFVGSGQYHHQMCLGLELYRCIDVDGVPSISVRVSHFLGPQDLLKNPQGFVEFDLPQCCCFSGTCSRFVHRGRRSLSDAMSLGTGVIDWSLPTIGIIVRALQCDTLGHLAGSVTLGVSSDVNDLDEVEAVHLIEYLGRTFSQISSLNLRFGSLTDLWFFLFDPSIGTLRASLHRDLSQRLASFPELRFLKFTFTGSAAMAFTAMGVPEGEGSAQEIVTNHVALLDRLFMEVYLLRRDMHLERLRILFQVGIPHGPRSAIDPLLNTAESLEYQEKWLNSMFRNTKKLDPTFLTVRIGPQD
ncbi:hypothetical protein D9757_009994 [Collybiopsis confluens]|uniref:F-box domain-containing protein n=1 Tax=Collybiopsis confluens TaxID=2823264 RepID=A0A8H5GV67_9AGAR|nr:hypothetical protein D9757_009994 [Collybiopsis confluens]